MSEQWAALPATPRRRRHADSQLRACRGPCGIWCADQFVVLMTSASEFMPRLLCKNRNLSIIFIRPLMSTMLDRYFISRRQGYQPYYWLLVFCCNCPHTPIQWCLDRPATSLLFDSLTINAMRHVCKKSMMTSLDIKDSLHHRPFASIWPSFVSAARLQLSPSQQHNLPLTAAVEPRCCIDSRQQPSHGNVCTDSPRLPFLKAHFKQQRRSLYRSCHGWLAAWQTG